MAWDALTVAIAKSREFEIQAHSILAKHESAPSRVISVDQTRQRLHQLSLQQDELLNESLTCIEVGAFRAVHVAAWAAFIDHLEQKLASDGLVRVKQARPAWGKYSNMDELRENVPEAQLIDVAKELGLLSKSEAKTLHGHLSKRNECAHPTKYKPGLNESLGYISEILNRLEQIQPRKL